MAKFEVGDTVYGNNSHPSGEPTCTGCTITVTNTGVLTFSGVIDDHPLDEDGTGKIVTGLLYKWFDLEESAVETAATSSAPQKNPPQKYKVGEIVTVKKDTWHMEDLGDYDGLNCQVTAYKYFDFNEYEWVLMVNVLGNGPHDIRAYENELEPCEDKWPAPKVNYRVSEVIIVTPAHEKPQPIGGEKLEVKKYIHEFDETKVRKRGHVPLDVCS